MESSTIFEIVGYAGSAFIIASITQRSILRLRIFGLAGGLVFLAYALLIEAYPIAVVNAIAAGIHVFYLREVLLRPDEVFSVLHVDADSAYLRYFLDFHAKDIERFFGGLPEDDGTLVTVFVLRDLIPAGLYIGRHVGDRVESLMDYAIPQYRDLKVGRFLYSHTEAVFGRDGVSAVVTRTSSSDHAAYLRKMGFLEEGEEFVLHL